MNSFTLGLLIFWEFFKIGLFAVGGGPATIPYLIELTNKYDWFTLEELTNMIAVSESTPGPIGLNMATYVGYQTLGIWGGIISTFGLVFPSLVIICIIAAFFAKMNKNKTVQAAFNGIRPAVAAIIAVSVFSICKVSLVRITEAGMQPVWSTIILSVVVLLLLHIKKLKKIHPFFWFVAGAGIGLLFKF